MWPEERIKEPDCTIGAGYTEAKWISENILEEASRRTPLRATVVRVGQLVGGPGGYWSEREWFPSLVKSAQYVGCLPAAEGVSPTWERDAQTR